MTNYLPLILSAMSGVAGGYLIGKILNSDMGRMARAITGVAGGIVLYIALAMIGEASEPNAVMWIKSIIAGAVGGVILTAIFTLLIRK